MKVLFLGSFPDRLNSNTVLRRHAANGFASVPGCDLVSHGCPEQDAPMIERETWDLCIFMGSIMLDDFDLFPLLDRARDRLSADGRIVLWLHDDPYEFDTNRRYQGMFDAVYTTDPTAALYYRRPEPVRWLPLAACPDVHYRPAAAPVRAWDFFFCGVAFSNRIASLRAIEAAGFRGRVFGASWPAQVTSARNRRLATPALVEYYNLAPVTLVLGRDLDLRNQQYRLRQSIFGPRVYEAAMAGAAQLCVDTDHQLFNEFHDGTHLVCARRPDEVTDALHELLADPVRNLMLRRSAIDRAMAEHTYRHRAIRLIGDLWP